MSSSAPQQQAANNNTKENREQRLVRLEELTVNKNTPQQAWLSIRGVVWDVTAVLAWHPGGQKIILDQAGKPDCSQVFERYHSVAILENVLGKPIGKLEGTLAGEGNEDERKTTSPTAAASSSIIHTNNTTSPWISLKDAELEAQRKASEISFAYWTTGAEDEITTAANEQIFRRQCWFKPHVLRNVSSVDMSCEVFGCRSRSPVFISPMAIHSLANEDLAELCAFRAAKRANVTHIAAHLSSRPWEDFLIEDGIEGTCPRFFQVYLPRSRDDLLDVIRRAEACGFRALFVTVDSASVGKRERDIRTRNRIAGIKSAVAGTAPRVTQTSQWNDAFSFDDLPDLIKMTRLPIVLKGIQRGDDAVRAVKAGVAGIMVSNHGGRNLDTSRPTLACLVEVVSSLAAAGLRRKVPIFFDGGVRRGGDVIKAMCLGADFVGIGRPILYGVAARGEEGALEVLNILHTEMEMTMKLIGCASIRDLNESLVEYGKSYL